MTKKDFKAILSRLIGNSNVLSNNVLFIDYCKGNHSKAQLLSQMFYWSSRSTRKDGYFAKTYDEWYEEIRVPKHSIFRYSKEFKADDFLDTKVVKFNGFPTLHYKLDIDKLIQSLVTFCNNGKLHGATNDCDKLQLTKDSDKLQLTSNRDYQKPPTEITSRDAPAKKTAKEIFELAEKAFPSNEINQEDFDGENSAKFIALKNEAPTPLELGRLMAEYYETEQGRNELKTMCYSARVDIAEIDAIPDFMQPLCTNWAQSKQLYERVNWRKHTGTLTNWIRNEYNTVKRSPKPSAAKESNNSVSKLKESGVYDNTPVISYQ